MSKENVNIRVKDVKQMLNNGKTREQIAEHYGIPMAAAKKTIFAHPEIKGLKTKKTYNFINIIDSESEDTDVNVDQEASSSDEQNEATDSERGQLDYSEPEQEEVSEQEEVPDQKVEWED